jgi:MHS family alpha-ketoglutarate permease-like MFS transporter
MFAATLGTMVEWADWLIYATLSSVFSRQFFPSSDPAVSLLSSFAVFAVGFLMRPIGGAVLGAYGDRHGRKKGLTLSITLMALGSFIIAFCPGYASIGLAAPVILIIARLLQGFSAGGEFGSASTFLIETASPRRRAFAGSWQHFAVNAGVLVAAMIGFLLTSVFDDATMAAWGWRVGFAVAGLMGFVALWVRLAVDETQAFKRSAAREREHHNPLRSMLKEHPKAALRVICIAMAGNLLNYLWLVHFPTYVHLKTGLPLREAFTASGISIVVSLVLIPLVGMLADRIGRKPVLMMFAGGSALFAYPGLNLLSNDFWTDTLLVTIGMALVTGFSATCAAVMAEQFPAKVRVTGVALPYAISVTLFGGTAPYIMTAMTNAGHSGLIWVYVAGISLVGFVVYATMPETKGKELD